VHCCQFLVPCIYYLLFQSRMLKLIFFLLIFTSAVVEVVLTTGGHVLLGVVAQGHLDTRIDHGPAARATRLHLRGSVIPGLYCLFRFHLVVISSSLFKQVTHLPILTGLQLIVKDLPRTLQWTAEDQGVEALQRIAGADLPISRGPLLLASEVDGVD
jgi:hypothetical protein